MYSSEKNCVRACLFYIKGLEMPRNFIVEIRKINGSGSLLVMEMSFKRGQTCHDKERSEIAKERYLASGQNRIDTHPASPKVSQIQLIRQTTIMKEVVFASEW